MSTAGFPANRWGRLFFGNFLLATQKKVTALRHERVVAKSEAHSIRPNELAQGERGASCSTHSTVTLSLALSHQRKGESVGSQPAP